MIKMYFMNQIRFDFGAVKLLAKELKILGIQRPLLITDQGLVSTGLAETVMALIPENGAMYAEVGSNPTAENVDDAVKAFHEHGADGLVALGGGSAIDLAKGVSLMATHDGEIRDYDIMKMIRREGRRINDQCVPLLAIPTASGTGSEVAGSALITVGDGEKIVLSNDYLLPRVVLADPELTLSLPVGLTAATGIDALSHCVEGILARNDNPPAKAVALDGAGRIYRNLRRVVEAPDDRDARSEMLMGAIEGGMVMANGLGSVHGLSHALGGLHWLNLHHGTVNSVLMPWVCEFNQSDAKAGMESLRSAFGLQANADLADALRQLASDVGMPEGLGEMGFSDDLIPRVAQAAMNDVNTLTNPRKPSVDDYEQLLSRAM